MSSHNNKEARPMRSSRSSSHTNIPIAEKMRRRRSSDTNEPRTTGFDVHRIYETFDDALREPENPKSPIGTQAYIDGYRELLK